MIGVAQCRMEFIFMIDVWHFQRCEAERLRLQQQLFGWVNKPNSLALMTHDEMLERTGGRLHKFNSLALMTHESWAMMRC